MEYKGSFDYTFVMDSGDQFRIFGANSDFMAISITPNGDKESVIKLDQAASEKISPILLYAFNAQKIGKKV